MARGELKQEVPVRSADELGTLTVAFNQLSADLARANELRRPMTADDGHDLRTPLTVITGYIEGLRDGVLKPTPARYEAMYTEAQHLRRLVEDLRTLSLADAGELPMQRVPVSSQALLERLAAAYAPQAEACDVSVLVSAEAGLPDIMADPERINQVLGNLVTNALRYTPAGGRIGLSAHGRGSVVALEVEDSGAGIASDLLPPACFRAFLSRRPGAKPARWRVGVGACHRQGHHRGPRRADRSAERDRARDDVHGYAAG